MGVAFQTRRALFPRMALDGRDCYTRMFAPLGKVGFSDAPLLALWALEEGG